jgi:nondiscriminating aspartyl-tRNA synthetase
MAPPLFVVPALGPRKASAMSHCARTFIAYLPTEAGNTVMICGWVSRLRVLARTTFIIVKDCTGEAQCVSGTDALRDVALKPDDAVQIEGVVRMDARAKMGVEIDCTGVHILNPVTGTLPFNSASEIANVSLEIRLDYRPLALRNGVVGDVFRTQAAILRYCRIHSPRPNSSIITALN